MADVAKTDRISSSQQIRRKLLEDQVGFGTYLYLLNPVSYASHSPYEFLTASLPTAVVGGLVYLIATLAIVRPAGKGDY